MKKALGLILTILLAVLLTVSISAAADNNALTGDLDNDSFVTDSDAVYLLFHTYFPEDYPITQSCDYDGDGSLTDSDAVYLLFHTYFPEDYPLDCDSLGHNYTKTMPDSICEGQVITYKCSRCGDLYTEQLEKISADISVGYWGYNDGTLFVQDVLFFNGITGGHGDYSVVITYTDIINRVFQIQRTNISDLNTLYYLGNSSWNTDFIGMFDPAHATVEIQDEIGFKTTFDIHFPGLGSSEYSYQEGVNHYSSNVFIDMKVETLAHTDNSNYVIDYTYPSDTTPGCTTLTCQICGYSQKETWEDITLDLSYTSGGYGMYGLDIYNVKGGAIVYKNGVRVKNNYSISIVNTAVGYTEASGYIYENTGEFSNNAYTLSNFCKYNIILSDGYSTYVFSSDYTYQYPVLEQHITPSNDNNIRFSVKYDKHDDYSLYRLRVYAIHGGFVDSDNSNLYTVTVKNLVDNTSNTYTNIKEYVGIVVGNTYSSYSKQKYEITITDGVYTYVYRTSINYPTPQLQA